MEYIVFLTLNTVLYRFQTKESGGCAKKSGLAFFLGVIKGRFFPIWPILLEKRPYCKKFTKIRVFKTE